MKTKIKKQKMKNRTFKCYDTDWELAQKVALESNQSVANFVRSAILEKIFRINGGK